MGEARVVFPVMRPAHGKHSDADRLFNRDLSSMRMPAEHAIGRMKWWRTMRYWTRDPQQFGPTGKAIAVLASIT